MNDYGFTWTTSGELVPAKTLRDEFAMAALTGHSSIPDDRRYSSRPAEIKDDSIEEWQAWLLKQDAEHCYKLADAMMEARGK